MPIPAYAQQDFRGLRTERQPAPPPSGEDVAERPLTEAARGGRPPAGTPPGAGFDLGLAVRRVAPFVLFLSLVACKGDPTVAGAPPLASAPVVFSSRSAGAVAGAEPAQHGSALAAAFQLTASVDELGARVARLDPDAYARPVGSGCADACGMWGTQRLTFRPGRAECVCRRTPNLGTSPNLNPSRAARAQKAARLETVVGPQGPVAVASAGGTL